jgi:cellulose synthase/poly-beta-1,6-N-acetylglucosamine synthase-like glycosyltransferase
LRLAKAVFWTSAGLLAYTQIGYPLALAAASALRRKNPRAALPAPPQTPPRVALIVAAHDEQEVIAGKVANALALDWPRERLEVVVCCDGCSDETAERARAAGADRVLELARGGKVRAQNAGVDATTSDLVAFSDANASWEREALTELARAFADPSVGYACGQVRFTGGAGDGNASPTATPNEEGLYWRYEMWVRERESELRSVTAGNGAIYATRRESYIRVDPAMDHDLSFPFNMVKRGWRAVYVPSARATEKMVPTIEGEFARKRRMMSHGAWPTVIRGGLADPRGYDPAYAAMIVSHRLLRYATPGLHLAALATSIRLAARPGTSPVYSAALASQLALLAAAAAAPHTDSRAANVARYYVLTTTSLALGLYDWLRHGTRIGWGATVGTR